MRLIGKKAVLKTHGVGFSFLKWGVGNLSSPLRGVNTLNITIPSPILNHLLNRTKIALNEMD